MKSKPLIGLAAVTALVVIGAVAAVMSRQAATERVAMDSIALPDLMAQINDVRQIALTGSESDFALRFDGARWVAPTLADFPADFDKVKKALINLAELRLIEAKTADPERYAALGLAEPDADEGGGTWVRLLGDGDAPVAALMVGEAGRGGADQVYVRRDGEAQTWLAHGEIDLGETPLSWVDSLVTRLDAERVRRVTIVHADGERLELAKLAREDESFALANMPEGATLRSPLTLDNVGRALAFLRFDDVAAASEGPEKDAGDSTATFETFDGVTVTVTLQKRGEATWARIDTVYDSEAVAAPEEAPEDAETEAATEEEPFDVEADFAQLVSRTENWVFQIADFKAEQLGMRLDRLIDLPGEDGDGPEGDGSDLVPGAMPPVIQLD